MSEDAYPGADLSGYPPLTPLDVVPLHAHEDDGFLYACRMDSPTDDAHYDFRCQPCVRIAEQRCKYPFPPANLIRFGETEQQIVPLRALVDRSLVLLGMEPMP